ncbi:MAG: UMP kinase [Clostridia bacterium]
MNKPIYKRVIMKISGEALAGETQTGIKQEIVNRITDSIKAVYDMGVEIGLVVGGGNFWRGKTSEGMDRTTADHMGMLATVINALALQDALETRHIPVRVQTALEMSRIAEPYVRRRAMRHLEKGRVVIFACGTGNPYFSTDTAVALRGAEIEAEVILMAKNIDGVYDSDPEKNPNAKKFSEMKYMDIISNELQVMDNTAVTLCKENKIPIIVFGIDDPENIMKVITGDISAGTIVR